MANLNPTRHPLSQFGTLVENYMLICFMKLTEQSVLYSCVCRVCTLITWLKQVSTPFKNAVASMWVDVVKLFSANPVRTHPGFQSCPVATCRIPFLDLWQDIFSSKFKQGQLWVILLYVLYALLKLCKVNQRKNQKVTVCNQWATYNQEITRKSEQVFGRFSRWAILHPVQPNSNQLPPVFRACCPPSPSSQLISHPFH